MCGAVTKMGTFQRKVVYKAKGMIEYNPEACTISKKILAISRRQFNYMSKLLKAARAQCHEMEEKYKIAEFKLNTHKGIVERHRAKRDTRRLIKQRIKEKYVQLKREEGRVSLAKAEKGGEVRKCAVCLEKPAHVTVQTCGHVCFCSQCAEGIRYQCDNLVPQARCPICRSAGEIIYLFFN